MAKNQIIYRNISELKKLPGNPRQIKSEDFKTLCKSLIDNPDYFDARPLILSNRTGELVIISGNQRFEAAKENKLMKVPTFLLEGLTEAREREIIIRDNVNNGTWDFELLANEWDVEELKDWGVDLPVDFGTELEAEEDNFEIPDVIETDIKIGDLFTFSKGILILHKLLCGDSTCSDTVAKLMNGEKADMAHNDPPYGMKKEKEGVLNDNLNYSDLLNFNSEWIALQFTHLKENGSWYCWGTDEPLMDIYSEILKPYIKEQKATFRNLITWNKGHGQGQNAEEFRMYPIADEKCLFVMMGVQGFNNNADNYFDGWEPIRNYLLEERTKCGWSVPDMKRIAGHSDLSRDHWTGKSQFNFPTKEVYLSFQKWAKENKPDAFTKEYEVLKKEYEVLKKEYEVLKKEYYSTRAYFNNTHDNQNNVWHFERTSNKEKENTGNHATVKPILLCERVIKSSCPDNGLIIDLFLGSGSTLMACEMLNRRCFGLEISPQYCEVIIQRYCKYMMKENRIFTITKNGNDVTKEYQTKC